MDYNYKPLKIKFEEGSVIIAGAGPGNIKLLTYKVFCALKTANIVIFDAFVNKSILNFCGKKTKLIFAGKLKGRKSCTQEEINEWMKFYALKKKKILRLKGGDPSFFSRSTQEAAFLKKNKIKFQIFSGITASQSSLKTISKDFFEGKHFCNLITGHRRITSPEIKMNFNLLTKNQGKIIVYMGVGQLEVISENLIKNGLKKNTKVSIVCNASLPNQKIFFSKLGNCQNLKKKNDLKSPAIIVIG